MNDRPVQIVVSLDMETYMEYKILAQKIGVTSDNLGYTAVLYFLSAMRKRNAL